jgi:phosphohistidine phosphatase
MMLYILRHAEAEDAAAGADDETRPLTEKGRDDTHKAAARMRAFGLDIDVILTSPLVRALETARIFATAYAELPAPHVLPALGTGASVADALAAIVPFARRDAVMVVGHEPQLSAMVSTLLTGAADKLHLRLRKGGCVALELPIGRLERGGAELHWMMTQRQLRKLKA